MYSSNWIIWLQIISLGLPLFLLLREIFSAFVEQTGNDSFDKQKSSRLPAINSVACYVYEQEFMGLLFTIRIWSKEEWSKDEEEVKGLTHISKIGEKGDEIFTLSTPSDVQYDLHDEKLKAEYDSMWNHINTIKTTFKVKK